MAPEINPSNSFPLPAGLPAPVDDGACRHLTGMPLPDVELLSTSGRIVNLAAPGSMRGNAQRTVVYGYPMTGVPGTPLPEGWDAIPGARGCTPQSCGFRDRYDELTALGVEVFGLSTQSSAYQKEMAGRLHLPFEVLSDAEFKFAGALRLPTFEVGGMRLLKRVTLIVRFVEGPGASNLENHGGRAIIEAALYPVFPPNESAANVIHWLAQHPY